MGAASFALRKLEILTTLPVLFISPPTTGEHFSDILFNTIEAQYQTLGFQRGACDGGATIPG